MSSDDKSEKRFILLLEKINEIKKCVNKMQVKLETHIAVCDQIDKSKNQKSRSNREKIAIIISIIATTIAFFSIIPPLLG